MPTKEVIPSTREPQPVPKIYEFEFEAPPEQLFEETLSAVNVLGFWSSRGRRAFTFNTGPSIWSNAGQDMTATAEPISKSWSRLVFSGKTAQRGLKPGIRLLGRARPDRKRPRKQGARGALRH